MNEKMPGDMSRKSFIKKLVTGVTVAALAPTELFSQSQEKISKTYCIPTNEKFKNGEVVWRFEDENGLKLGEFWPIRGLNLVTKQTDPEVFKDDMKDLHDRLGGVATAPDGMTGGSFGSRVLEGKSLSNGRPCGDGKFINTGIVVVDKGFDVQFTHAQEHSQDFDSFYEQAKKEKKTLFFLPSIYRNGKYLSSTKVVEKVLVRRQTPDGIKMGVVIFDSMQTYDEARKAILGLDRAGKSSTSHIYYLDGGNTWGQCAKEVNGKVVVMGKRDPDEVTNYLVFY